MVRDDPVALRSERLFGVFAQYLAWRMGRDFHGVRLSAAGRPAWPSDRPLVVYSNHPSWWDPAMMIVLAHRLFRGRPGFAPMEQRAFERYGIFRRMGVFGIGDGVSGARRFLDVAERALSVPGGMLWVNAEGAFTDARTRPVAIRPGVAHLARRRRDALMVPLAMEFGFWDESKPEAMARFGEPVALDGVDRVGPIAALLSDALERTMDGLAADSATRDARRFVALVRGRTGTDRVYDGWRRTRSLLRGRRFDPAHGAGR